MNFEIIDIQNDLGNQAIKIPENLKIDDDKVYVKKVGNALYLIPFHDPWQSLFQSLEKFTPDFMQERNQMESQSREAID